MLVDKGVENMRPLPSRNIHNWFWFILGVASGFSSYIFNDLLKYNGLNATLVFIISSYVSAIGQIWYSFGDFSDYYAKYPIGSVGVKQTIFWLIVVLLLNIAMSGIIIPYIHRSGQLSFLSVLNDVLQQDFWPGIRDGLLWVLVHALTALISVVLLYFVILRLANKETNIVNRNNAASVLPITIMSLFATGTFYSPAGTIVWGLQSQLRPEQFLSYFILRSFILFISSSIVAAILTHYLFLALPRQIVSYLVQVWELVVGVFLLLVTATYMLSTIGTFDEQYKQLIYFILALQYYVAFIAGYHLTFVVMNKIELKRIPYKIIF